MPRYAYRAVGICGRVTRGEMTTANENELVHNLGENGLELIEAVEKRPSGLRLTLGPTRVPLRALALFCERMRDLMNAGLPFADALREVAISTDHRVLADSLTQILRSVSNGASIANSFALHPVVFSPMFIAIASAGEKSGDMATVFGFLARYVSANALTQERLRRALRYPLLLLIVSGGAIIFMLAMVVPQILLFLKGIDAKLPVATRLLLSLSRQVIDNGLWLGCGVALLLAAPLVARAVSDSWAVRVDRLILRLPFLGAVIVKTSLARFSHSFSLLFRSGCPVPDCLMQAGKSLDNRALRGDMDDARQRVLAGTALSIALSDIMPALALGLLRTGERSGNLGKSLDDIATIYDREAQMATDSFIAMLEPMLTLVIGGFLAWTMMAVLGPLYGSLAMLGGKF